MLAPTAYSCAPFALASVGQDAIADFKHSQSDKIILDKTTFSAISSATGTGLKIKGGAMPHL
ncbi:hypothetical protein KBT16_16620 [Nostoc sp. CCCryo 231-06]|nr:hypothetical protein [Nostoc sp. CCCryo 231-06]